MPKNVGRNSKCCESRISFAGTVMPDGEWKRNLAKLPAKLVVACMHTARPEDGLKTLQVRRLRMILSMVLLGAGAVFSTQRFEILARISLIRWTIQRFVDTHVCVTP